MVFAITEGIPEKVKEIIMDAEWVISIVMDKVMAIAAEEGTGINTDMDGETKRQ